MNRASNRNIMLGYCHASAYWAIAFVTLVLALLITALIYAKMIDGPDLNARLTELFIALFASAGQAGGYLLEQKFQFPKASMDFPSFWLCCKPKPPRC